MKEPKKHTYRVEDYSIHVRYQWPEGHPEMACYTAEVDEMPGIITGARTAEAAVSECQAALADVIAWYERDGMALPAPGSLPPPVSDEDNAASPAKHLIASAFGRMGGAVKSPRKAAAVRRNGLLGAKYGKLGGRPKGSKNKKALAAA